MDSLVGHTHLMRTTDGLVCVHTIGSMWHDASRLMPWDTLDRRPKKYRFLRLMEGVILFKGGSPLQWFKNVALIVKVVKTRTGFDSKRVEASMKCALHGSKEGCWPRTISRTTILSIMGAMSACKKHGTFAKVMFSHSWSLSLRYWWINLGRSSLSFPMQSRALLQVDKMCRSIGTPVAVMLAPHLSNAISIETQAIRYSVAGSCHKGMNRMDSLRVKDKPSRFCGVRAKPSNVQRQAMLAFFMQFS